LSYRISQRGSDSPPARELLVGASVSAGMCDGTCPTKRGIPMKATMSCLGLFFVLIFGCPTAANAESAALVLTHMTVIDPAAGIARNDQTVVISAGKIAAVGGATTVRAPKGARIIDASGKFLIPGLWDMHVHIAGISAEPAWSKNVILPELI